MNDQRRCSKTQKALDHRPSQKQTQDFHKMQDDERPRGFSLQALQGGFAVGVVGGGAADVR